MGGQPEPELLEIPGAEGISVDFFTDLLGQVAPIKQVPLLEVGAAQQIPSLQTAGMSAAEKTTQSLLAKFLGTPATEGQAYKLGMGELSKTLGGEFYDPRTSDFWKGYRDVSAMEQEKGIAAVRRRGQLGGGLYGEPGQRTEAEYIKGMGATRTMMLGSLFEKERERRLGATGQALGYAGFEETGKLSRLQVGSTIGAIPRDIQQQKYRAEFARAAGQSQADYTQQRLGHQATFAQASGQAEAQHASELFPYTYQSAVAQQLMPQWFVPGQDNTAIGVLGLLGSIIGGK